MADTGERDIPQGRGSRAQRRRWRASLFHEAGGVCPWCGGAMVLVEGHRRREPDPKNRAVLYHLDSRLDSDRGAYGHGMPRSVIACFACANEMAAGRVSLLSKEALWARSGRAPADEKAGRQ